jgi:hypothetical protein
LTAEEASKQLLSSGYALPDIGVDANDTLKLQFGKLVGLSRTKTVIELETGLRLHFPKVGYFVRKAGAEEGQR